jgi:CubicO group peptidase (beta-lactamase class C family)
MKSAVRSLFVIVLAMAAYGQAATFAQPPSGQGQPLRLSAPVEAIIADLEGYIPEYIREENIPGVAIALIRDGEIQWTAGFGVTNTITAEPVTPETLFEVASNSKVITAYIALRLVDQGVLSLDEPLNEYLPQPWLPPSEYRNAITLRRVLSHSSGLGANITLSRDSLFAPGDGYYYSGIGFMYLQEVIEQVTGQSLEDVAQQMVFVPLGMSSSSFVDSQEITPRTANGHLHAGIPAVLFTVPYVVSVVLVGIFGLLVLRIRTGQWRPGRWMVVGAAAVAYVLSLLPALILLGRVGLLEFVWLLALCGLILVVTFALALFVGRAAIVRLSPDRPIQQRVLTFVWSLLIVVGLTLLVSEITNLPVPRWPATHANAAGTVRATAGDLATFLIELSEPRHLSEEITTQMQTSQVTLSRELSWGLGLGIQHSQQGNALWQWGQHLDFQSVMIIYPASGFGVAVCTNNDLLNPDVALEIAHRAVGGEIEPIRRAIRLEFNYRQGG